MLTIYVFFRNNYHKEIYNFGGRMISIIQRKKMRKVICVILSGGYAQRLYPLTENMAKVLIPIAGIPCLNRVIECIQCVDSIDKIVFLVNLSRKEEISNNIKNIQFTKTIEIVCEPEEEQRERWGPMRALNFFVSSISNQEEYKNTDFLIIGGDNLLEFNLSTFCQFAQQKSKLTIALYRHNFDIDIREVGTANINEQNIIQAFAEKQQTTKFPYISIACYYLRKNDLRYINNYLEENQNNLIQCDNLGMFIHWLKNEMEEEIAGYTFTEKWFDIGTRDHLLKANSHYLTNQKTIHGELKGRTEITAPVLVMGKTEISNSDIGPNVFIGENCYIEGSEIKNSIIMNNCKIVKSHIANSVVGPESWIEGNVSVNESTLGPRTWMTRG